MVGGAHKHYAGWGKTLQAVEQQVGKEKLGKVVDLELYFCDVHEGVLCMWCGVGFHHTQPGTYAIHGNLVGWEKLPSNACKAVEWDVAAVDGVCKGLHIAVCDDDCKDGQRWLTVLKQSITKSIIYRSSAKSQFIHSIWGVPGLGSSRWMLLTAL